jgi:hypothetical protein
MRKLKHLLASIATAVVVALAFSTAAMAQHSSQGCFPDDPDCGAWAALASNPQILTLGPGCVVSVDVYIRTCNDGTQQFRYGAYTIVPDANGNSNCNFLGSLTQLIDLAILQQNYNGGPIPSCESGQVATRYVVFSAACYALQTCTYQYNCNAIITCDFGSGPYPPTTRSWTTYRYFPCGTACCSREYEICRGPVVIGSGSTIYITRNTPVIQVPCSNPQGYPTCTVSCD